MASVTVTSAICKPSLVQVKMAVVLYGIGMNPIVVALYGSVRMVFPVLTEQ